MTGMFKAHMYGDLSESYLKYTAYMQDRSEWQILLWAMIFKNSLSYLVFMITWFLQDPTRIFTKYQELPQVLWGNTVFIQMDAAVDTKM